MEGLLLALATRADAAHELVDCCDGNGLPQDQRLGPHGGGKAVGHVVCTDAPGHEEPGNDASESKRNLPGNLKRCRAVP